MNEQLKEYRETVITPQYESFDKAHNLMHVNTVIAESLELAKGYPVDVIWYTPLLPITIQDCAKTERPITLFQELFLKMTRYSANGFLPKKYR